jgi:acetyltransferase-like isoleucine patch superfamily enzyme
MSVYRTLALSVHPLAKTARRYYRAVLNFSLPAPRLIFKPLLWLVLACRQAWFFVYRVFVCEPLFKAYCAQVGANFHTGVFLHWVTGEGNLVIGNQVTIDGKCSFMFAARFAENPTLAIGDNTGIGHACSFTVGESIVIGRDCRIAGGVAMFDSPGHPLDPAKRRAGLPANPDDVRPIRIGDNVWIGTGAVIFPGVTIGENSVVSAGAVVLNDVPANLLVAGNPARKLLALKAKPGSIAP